MVLLLLGLAVMEWAPNHVPTVSAFSLCLFVGTALPCSAIDVPVTSVSAFSCGFSFDPPDLYPSLHQDRPRGHEASTSS